MVNVLWSIVNIENHVTKSDAKAATSDTREFAEPFDLSNMKTEESLLKVWKTLTDDTANLRSLSLVKKTGHDTGKKILINSKSEDKYQRILI